MKWCIMRQIFNNPYFVFPNCTIFFSLTAIVVYFLFFRGALEDCIIKRLKLTKKERKKIEEEKNNRSKKDLLKIFIRWILCLSYTEEQKGSKITYTIFVLVNYTYLFIFIIFQLTWILAFFYIKLQDFCNVIIDIKLYFFDFPMMVLIMVLFFIPSKLRD